MRRRATNSAMNANGVTTKPQGHCREDDPDDQVAAGIGARLRVRLHRAGIRGKRDEGQCRQDPEEEEGGEDGAVAPAHREASGQISRKGQ